MVRLRTQLQNRIHAVVADFGYDRSGSYLSAPGRGWLADLELRAISRKIVTDALAVIDGLALLIDRIDGELRQHAKADPRVKTLTTLRAWASSPPWSCWPRSGISPASPAPASWPAGPG